MKGTRFCIPIVICILLHFSVSGYRLDAAGAKEDSDTAGIDEHRADRFQMVESQIEARGVDDALVLRAMRTVPRHRFVPDDVKAAAYADHPLPIGSGQTISQPYIVALMSDLLEIEPGDRVLEVGTGSGYQAAVLAEMGAEVITIEIIRELADRAKKTLEAAGYAGVTVIRGDGYFGRPEEAPYQGIIVTAAAGHVPPPLIEQLAPGGRIIIPVGSPYEVQVLTEIRKDESGEVSYRRLLPVRFVPMTGRVQE